MEADYERSNKACPKCNWAPTHFRNCSELDCEEGVVDLYEQDAIVYQPGETAICTECKGTGTVAWCPNCGQDLN